MNTENSKINEPHILFLNLTQRLGLRSSSNYVALQNSPIYYTCKNIRQRFNNNKLRIKAPTWNNEFELPDVSISVSKSQDCIEYIIAIYETLSTNHPIHSYINRINNKLVFKIKDWYKLQLQTPETIKSFGSTTKMAEKTKNGENGQSLEVVEEDLVQFELLDNQYQQNS